MSVYAKLQQARILLQNTKLKKSGHNKFANYYYFELGDFLPDIQNICQNIGLCGLVSFTEEMAYLNLHDTEDGSFTTFTSPMSSAALKGCHAVQNLGAVQTYLRRYLWVNAFEIVEHDALEPLTGKEDPVKFKEPAPKPVVTKPAEGEWVLTPIGDKFSAEWFEGLKAGVNAALSVANKADDVANIFKNNRTLFDEVKEADKLFYETLMTQFSDTKKSLTKE